MRGKASIGYGQRGFGGLGWGTGNSGFIKSLNFSHFFIFQRKGGFANARYSVGYVK